MKVILFGATGMVGQGVLRECLLEPRVTAVLAVGRAPSGKHDPKLKELVLPDLFQYQAGETISDCYAVQGPIHPQLNIAMDLGIVARTPSGAILTLSLSFNNDGPLGSFFRYICDNGTYKAFYDDLSDGKDNRIDVSKVDVSMDGIELEDREFIAAIKEKREPNGSLAQVLPCMHVLGKLEKIIDPQRKAHA